MVHIDLLKKWIDEWIFFLKGRVLRNWLSLGTDRKRLLLRSDKTGGVCAKPQQRAQTNFCASNLVWTLQWNGRNWPRFPQLNAIVKSCLASRNCTTAENWKTHKTSRDQCSSWTASSEVFSWRLLTRWGWIRKASVSWWGRISPFKKCCVNYRNFRMPTAASAYFLL